VRRNRTSELLYEVSTCNAEEGGERRGGLPLLLLPSTPPLLSSSLFENENEKGKFPIGMKIKILPTTTT
jgi:hypothetical protein